MVFIYVIELEKNKYYVGKTINPQFRLENHFNLNGSEWTKLYKPIRLVELKPDCDNYDEDKVTRQYMDKYGIENVRGGSFVSVKLEKSTMEALQQMSNGTNDRCFTCGKYGHFAKDCTDCKEYIEIIWCCEYCNTEFINEKNCKYHEKFCKYKYSKSTDDEYDEYDDDNCCFRCGRIGHYISSCYAKTHRNGRALTK